MVTDYQQEQDPFLLEEVERYPFAQWLNGQQLYDGPAGDPIGVASGWHIKAHEDETNELNLCLDALCEKWVDEVAAAKREHRQPNEDLHCKKVYVKFQGQSGAASPFYALRHLIVFPLAYNVANDRRTIWYNPKARNGVAHFWETPINRFTRQPEDDAVPYVKLLVVVKQLIDANYIDGSGKPLPIMLTTKKSSANFLYACLQKQMDVVKVARDNGMPAEVAQFYNFAMTLYAGKDRVEVGTVKKSYQYPMLTTTPDKNKLTWDFAKNTWAGDDLAPQLKELAQVGVDWSRARIDSAIRNQLVYGDASKQENMLFSDGTKARGGEGTQATPAPAVIPAPPAGIPEDKRKVLVNLERRLRSFDATESADAVKRVLEADDGEAAGPTILKYGKELNALLANDPY